MDLNFLMQYKSWPRWKVLQGELLRSHIPGFKNSYKNLSYYDLIEVATDSNDRPLAFEEASTGFSFYAIFSNRNLTRRMASLNQWHDIETDQYENTETLPTKTIMLGEFIHSLRNEKEPAAIKVNPIKTATTSGDEFYLAEEFIFAPIHDKLTNKYMITNPCEAKALLAINPEDVERFGINFVFI